MINPFTILLNIVGILLVIGTGWVARRKGLLTGDAVSAFSHFTVDFAMPSLIISNMLRRVTPEMLAHSWFYPFIGIGVVFFSGLIGLAASPFAVTKEQRRTFIFIAGVMNWLYLPFILVKGTMHGAMEDEAIAVILLFHVGISPFIWSVGVWLLRGSALNRRVLLHHLRTPGLLAAAASILAVVFIPDTDVLFQTPEASAPVQVLVGHVIMKAISLLGELALPMALVLTGARMASMKPEERIPLRAIAAITGIRLVAIPLLTGLALNVAVALGAGISPAAATVILLVAAMPVALNSSLFIIRFGGDSALSAKSVVVTTFLCVITVPLISLLFGNIG